MKQPINDLKITEIKLEVIEAPTNKIKAVADITLNHCLRLTGLRVIEGSHGLFVGYPPASDLRGAQYKESFHPTQVKLTEYIECMLIKQYNVEIGVSGITQKKGRVNRNQV